MSASESGRLVFSVAPIEAILRLAQRFPVFPCRRGPEHVTVRGEERVMKAKSPLTQHGLKDASQDPEQIRAWWARWPDALVGVPTGTATALVVIDLDVDKADAAAGDWVEEHSLALMGTRVHGTLSGGKHYLYRQPAGIEYRNGVCLKLGGVVRQGIDLRAEGGYIIWWPLHGGSAMGELAPLPAGLVDEQRIEVADLAPLSAASPEAWAKDRQLVADALAYLDPSNYDEWRDMGLAISLASGGSDDGFNLWHAWSSGEITGDCPANYSGINDCRYHWGSYLHDKPRGGLITLGSLFERAKAKGYTRTRDSAPPALPVESYAELADAEAREERLAIMQADATEAAGAPAKPDRRPMQWKALDGQDPPQRVWSINHWLTSGATLFAGIGGVGKTLVAQTFGAALALGRGFVSDVTAPSKALLWACEDEHDEIWRRQLAVCKYFGASLSDLEGKFIVEPRLGKENTLLDLIYGAPTWTSVRKELAEQVHDYGVSSLWLDNIGQLYGGKENDRHHVTAFINGLMGIKEGLAVIIMGHPAKTADSEFSGSTAWENAVRMRWYMGYRLPDQKAEEGTEEDTNVRYLAKRKANYTDKDFRKLTFRDGLFVPESPPVTTSLGYAERQKVASDCVVNALRKMLTSGIRTTDGKTSPDYLPKKMREMKLDHEFTPKELASALSQLRLSGRIVEGPVGQYANRMPKMGLVLT